MERLFYSPELVESEYAKGIHSISLRRWLCLYNRFFTVVQVGYAQCCKEVDRKWMQRPDANGNSYFKCVFTYVHA
jgi:hypothetical protein